MLSRDTKQHLLALVVALGLFVLADLGVVWDLPRRVSVFLFLIGYFVAFGGAHLVLALKGEDGMVSVASRIRYLVMLGILLVLASSVLLWGDRRVANVDIEAIAVVIAVVTLVTYVLWETRDAFRNPGT